MAALAPVPVELASFEDWDDRGRTFDLITFGDAWHWIDPERGWRKIARVLAPGGTVVRFWNHHEVDEPLRSAFEAVHRRVVPELEHARRRRRTPEDDPRVEQRTYRVGGDLQRRRLGRADRDLQRQPDARARAARRAPARAARGDHGARRHRRPRAIAPWSVVRVQRRVEPCPLARARERLDRAGARVAPEQQAVGAAQVAALDDLAVGQRDQRAGRDVEPGLDRAVVAEADADPGVGAEQAALADR